MSECRECKKRKLERAIENPFRTWFPNDAKDAEKELEYMRIEDNFNLDNYMGGK